MSFLERPKDSLRVTPEFQPLIRVIGLDARGVFRDKRIQVWRRLDDRENCFLDSDLGDGTKVRLHIKRYFPVSAISTPADDEFLGHQSLVFEKIPTAPLVGWGVLSDRSSFTIWLDLAGFTPGDKLVESGFPFEQLLEPTAAMAASLHNANLHHRDLYLCHFMAKAGEAAAEPISLRLIDTARVARLSSFLTRRRWIVKDLAQFWYSTTKLAVTDDQRSRWLARYESLRGVKAGTYRRSIERKVRSIAKHDANLSLDQPSRNVSIPK